MKLVRDNIPEIIERSGEWCLTRTVKNHSEHMHWLKEKMKEETNEFFLDPCYEEAADVLEVLKTFCLINNLDWISVVDSAEKKSKINGGFIKGIILEKVGKDVPR